MSALVEAARAALRYIEDDGDGETTLADALRTALAAEQPAEPVAWTVAGEVTNWARDFSKYRTQHYVRPVFAAPAAQPAAQVPQPLSDEQIERLAIDATDALPDSEHDEPTTWMWSAGGFLAVARAIERALLEKRNG